MFRKSLVYLLIISAFTSIIHATGSTCLERFGGVVVNDSIPIERIRLGAWMPNSTCFAVIINSQLRIYDIEIPDAYVVLAAADTQDSYLSSVAFSPDANQIAYNISNTLYRRDTENSAPPIVFEHGNIFEISFSPHVNQIAIGTGTFFEGYAVDYNLLVVDSDNTYEHLMPLDEFLPTDMLFTSESDLLVMGFKPGYEGSGSVLHYNISSSINLWETRDLFETAQQTYIAEPPFATVALAAANNILVTGGFYGYHDYDDYYGSAFLVWDIAEQALLTRIIVNGEGAGNTSDIISGIAITPDGLTVATGLNNGRIILWDWQNQAVIAELQSDIQPVYHIAFHPTYPEYLLVIGDTTNGEDSLRVWNTTTSEMIFSLSS